MKRSKLRRIVGGFAALTLTSAMLVGCSSDDESGDDTGGDNTSSQGSGGEQIAPEDMTIGFVAVGPEGGFRTANENNIQEAFADAGIELKYAPTQNNDQQKQLQSFASFVDEGVDGIVLSATEATGWEDSLADAQEAGIPVILVDRGIDPNDESLYTTHIGPSNIEAGISAGEWTVEKYPDGARAVVLEGPAGLSVVNDRNAGWEQAIEGSNIEVLENQSANWSTDEGKTVTEGLLDKYNNDIQVIFAQNDEMGVGAAQGVEAKGLKPGPDGDVDIITIDGTKPALEALIAGQLSYVIEYNPIMGEEVVDTMVKAVNGEEVPKTIVIESATFEKAGAEAVIDERPF